MKTPLVYSGVERAVDVPEGYEPHDSNKENELTRLRQQRVQIEEKKDRSNANRFLFQSPPTGKKRFEVCIFFPVSENVLFQF